MRYFSFICAAMLISFTSMNSIEKEKPRCLDKKSCLNDKKCQCYCSVKCGPRDKTSEDSPIWIENDPYGHHCYCRQRDVDLVKQCAVEKKSKR